ncbi:MAG: NAD(P)H-dependent oxidoreductase [Clostridia bacterium]|nr:NAD(P)H-dependent oxidoreductase [Clostridia bacterium]
MKITIIHGQGHKGSTYHITDMMRSNVLTDDTIVDEYFMPKDSPDFCIGCYRCFNKGEECCPHADQVQTIVKSIRESDLIMINSPAYCLEMTGQLKTLFDHLGYMWLAHRPNDQMFNKVAVVISTAAGSGAKRVTRSLAKQMFWLGVPVVYQFSYNVNASSWEEVPDKIKRSIINEIPPLALKIKKKIGHAKPGMKLKLMFSIMRMMQKSNNWNMKDRDYWQKQGWLGKERPW